jgi:CubicO group peptidase (beta-lactamase class C family)
MPKTPGIPSLLLGCLLSAGPLSAQAVLPRVSPEEADLASAPLREVSTLLESFVAEGRIAGAVVGVARGGRIGYLEATGLQDVASGSQMTERSLFRVYSMTKAVTAVAVMILHEEGRFQLSDPVSMYLPAFERVVVLEPDGSTRAPSRPPTIEHLLLHTAGLSHRSSAEYRAASVRARDISLDQFIDNVVGVPLRADPGEEYRYSAAPTVLGRLVEVWSGRPFDEFVEERILAPLGMSDTGFWVEPHDRDRLTTMYAASESGLEPFEIEEIPFTQKPALMEGAVGLVSTVPDFLRFAQMLLNGGELGGIRILQAGTVQRMTRNGLPEEILERRRGGTGWGLGNVSVVVDPTAAEDGAHMGEYRWDGSAGTEFWVDPSTQSIVVTMWQSAPANPGSLRARVVSLVREAVEDAR